MNMIPPHRRQSLSRTDRSDSRLLQTLPQRFGELTTLY